MRFLHYAIAAPFLLAGCLPTLEADCSEGDCPGEEVCRAGVCLVVPVGPDAEVDDEADEAVQLGDAARDAAGDESLPMPDAAPPVPDGPVAAPCPEALVDADGDPANGCERGCRLPEAESVGAAHAAAVAYSGDAVGLSVAHVEGLRIRELGGRRAVTPAGATPSDLAAVGTDAHWVASAFVDAAEGDRALVFSMSRAGGSTAITLAPDAVRGPSLVSFGGRVAVVFPTAAHIYLGTIHPSRPTPGDLICLDCDATAAPSPVRPAVFVAGEALWVVHARTDRRVAVTRVTEEEMQQWVAPPVDFALGGDLSAARTSESEWLVGSGSWGVILRLDAPDALVPAVWSLGKQGRLLALEAGPAWFGLDDSGKAIVVALDGTTPRGSAVLHEGVDQVDAAATADGGVALVTVADTSLSIQRLRCW